MTTTDLAHRKATLIRRHALENMPTGDARPLLIITSILLVALVYGLWRMIYG